MLVSLIISSDTIVKILSNKLIGSFHSVQKNQFPKEKKPNDMKIISLVKIQPKALFVLNQLCFQKYQKTLFNM